MSVTSRAAAGLLAGVVVLVGCTDDGGDGTSDPASPTASATEITGADEASELVIGLYEDDAVDRALELVADGSVPPEIADDVRGSFETIFARDDVEVRATVDHEIDGVPIVEVDTSDGIRWCVRPDGYILLQCRVGIAPATVDTGDTPVTVHRAEVDVFPEEQQLRVQLRAEEPFTFEGLLTLEEADGSPAPVLQIQGAVASQGEQVAQVGRDTELVPGTTLLLAWVTDVGSSLQRDLVLAFDNGAFDVQVEETEYFVR